MVAEKDRRGRGPAVWVVLLGVFVLAVIYFAFFTGTTGESTRTGDSIDAADVSEEPGAAPAPAE